MPITNNNGVYIYNGYNCTPNLLPTAQSIPMSPSDHTSVSDKVGFIPTPPTTAGNYSLSVTVVEGVPTYSWVEASGGGIQTAKYNTNYKAKLDTTITSTQYTSRPVEDT